MLWRRALTVLLGATEAVAAAGLAYHYLLLAGSIRGSRAPGDPEQASAHRPAAPLPRFAVVLPAHNEEAVIGDSVVRLIKGSDYPRERFDVHVVADYCDDGTAGAARAAGAVVHERRDGPRGRKGYALAWLFDRLLNDRYDAFVVFDADSQVAPDYLSRLSAVLLAGIPVVQGRHVIANPDSGTFAALADADMRLNNRLRNLAKTNLGLSARLMGDGMCFRGEILQAYPWSLATSLAEDREYGISLATQGVRVHYLPDAVSAGQAAPGWRDAGAQRLRWYGGVFEVQRRYLGRLLAAGWRRRDPAVLDLAFELLLPPFSALVLLAAGSTVAAGVMLSPSRSGSTPRPAARPIFATGLALSLAAAAFPPLGLLLDGAPASTLRALVLRPAYALWRTGIGLQARRLGGRALWVRTPRAETAQRGRREETTLR